MTKFASKSTRGFYDSEIHGENMPPDAVEITEAYYADLFIGVAKDKVIDWSGDVPVLADHPAVEPQVPQEVSRYQALAILHLNGLLATVKAMMADPATDPLTVLAFDSAQTFKRYSHMVLNMAQALGLSEQQLDDLFIAASQIE